jgi:hypothetical protein
VKARWSSAFGIVGVAKLEFVPRNFDASGKKVNNSLAIFWVEARVLTAFTSNEWITQIGDL